MTNDRNEFGSDFHYPASVLRKPNGRFGDCALFDSGRSALGALILANPQWKRVVLPNYYCHEVPEFLDRLGIETAYYGYIPNQESAVDPAFDQNDSVVVSVSYFGLVRPDLSSYNNAAIVEDLTHDLMQAFSSHADYCFGSLRKELPVPSGGFVFSPAGLPLPEAGIGEVAREAAARKFTAMFLKHEYLEARFDDKPYFRRLFSQGEEMFAGEKPSAMPEISRSLLLNLDLEAIFAQKRRNIASALDVLGTDTKFNFGTDKTGFGLTVLCESNLQRDGLREMLVSRNIFPAVLWPGQKTLEAQDFSSRVLFVHLDYRMSEADARHIATLIRGFFT